MSFPVNVEGPDLTGNTVVLRDKNDIVISLAPFAPPPAGPPIPVVSQYMVRIANLQGVELDELETKNTEWSFVELGPGAASFEIPLQHPKATRSLMAIGQRLVRIYRKGIMKWEGILLTDDFSDSNSMVRFGSEGMYSWLRYILLETDKSYTDVDQFDIVRDLINYAQAKYGLGITFENLNTSGVTRTVEYKGSEFRYIGEIIEELAALRNGFAFNLTPGRVWQMWSPDRGSDLDLVFELGKNVTGISGITDATTIATRVVVMGGAENDPRCVGIASATSELLAKYGLREFALTMSDVKDVGVLAARAAEELRKRQQPRFQPQIGAITNDPDWEAYNWGDTAVLKAQKGYIDFNARYKIISKTIALSDEGREVPTVFFDAAPVDR